VCSSFVFFVFFVVQSFELSVRVPARAVWAMLVASIDETPLQIRSMRAPGQNNQRRSRQRHGIALDALLRHHGASAWA